MCNKRHSAKSIIYMYASAYYSGKRNSVWKNSHVIASIHDISIHLVCSHLVVNVNVLVVNVNVFVDGAFDLFNVEP